MMQRRFSIVCIGAGNVATHLTKSLRQNGHEIVQVISRTHEGASKLAKTLQCDYSTFLSSIILTADLYIIAVNDDAIEKVTEELPDKLPLVVHTSGSTHLNVLSRKFPHSGVIYPLQTFSKEKEIDFKDIPLLIEATNDHTMDILRHVCGKLSHVVHAINSSQRKIYHIASVFACNFTNHMLSISEDILQNENLDFNLIKPLIQETFRKAEENPPGIVQTGPAARKDLKIIENHITSLINYPEYQKMYTFVSRSIIDFYNKT